MEKRRLGATNLFVNPVGLGCMGFSHAYGAAIEKSEAIKTIREAYELGYNFLIWLNVTRAKMLTARLQITKKLSVRH